MSLLVQPGLLDWTRGVDLAMVRLSWSGRHGCFGARTLVSVATPFGRALAAVVGTGHPREGQLVDVRPALEGGRSHPLFELPDLAHSALPSVREAVAAAREADVPILVSWVGCEDRAEWGTGRAGSQRIERWALMEVPA